MPDKARRSTVSREESLAAKIRVGAAVRLLRYQRGKSVADLAASAKIDIERLESIESGMSDPEISEIFLLARALEMRPVHLFDALCEVATESPSDTLLVTASPSSVNQRKRGRSRPARPRAKK
jgi:transcriptional regulator with XRE-family HTH domain